MGNVWNLINIYKWENNMFDIVALGELLIDFTDSGFSPNGMKLFERNAGGSTW